MRIEEAIKVLHDLQKYRRDQHVPAKYPMPHPKKIGEAIDCAIHNLRTCVQVSRVVEAYKPMQSIIDAIHDTVDIVKIIKPIYNFKARN